MKTFTKLYPAAVTTIIPKHLSHRVLGFFIKILEIKSYLFTVSIIHL